jgi:hypothetical protein
VLEACVDACKSSDSTTLFDSDVMAAVVEIHWQIYGRKHQVIATALHLLLLIVCIILTINSEQWLLSDSIGLSAIASILRAVVGLCAIPLAITEVIYATITHARVAYDPQTRCLSCTWLHLETM